MQAGRRLFLASFAILASLLGTLACTLAVLADLLVALLTVLMIMALLHGLALVATMTAESLRPSCHALRHKAALNHFVGTISLQLFRSEYLCKSLEITGSLRLLLALTLLGTRFLTVLGTRLVALLICLVTLLVCLIALLAILRAGLMALILAGLAAVESLKIQFKQLGLLVSSKVISLGYTVGNKLGFLFGGELGALSLTLTVTLRSGSLCHHCGETKDKA